MFTIVKGRRTDDRDLRSLSIGSVAATDLDRFGSAFPQMWKSSSLQFVYFLPDPTVLEVYDLYRDVIGKNPSAYQSGENPFGSSPTRASASGFLGSHGVNIESQPGRVDLILNPGLGPSPSDVYSPPAFEALEQAVEQMRTVAAEVCNRLALASRLAIICNMMVPTQNLADANRTLGQAVGMALRDDDVLDFNVVLNKRATLADPVGVTLNRVLTWSVGTMQQLSFGAPSGTLPSPGGFASPFGGQPIFQTHYSANVSMDMNTASDPARNFSSNEARHILDAISSSILKIGVEPTVANLVK